MPRYDSVRHPVRDAEIKQFQAEHPELSMKEITIYFNKRWEDARNAEMLKYQVDHPEMSLSQVVDYFSTKPVEHISQQRVWQIVNDWQPKTKNGIKI